MPACVANCRHMGLMQSLHSVLCLARRLWRRPGECFFRVGRQVPAWCCQLPAQGVDVLIARCVVSREAFVAPAGRVLLSADYAQMELRLMAHLSGDASLIATLSDPLQDPFTHWAAQWLRIPPPAVGTPE